ncbi:unnamed protein product [Rangifer tarandus platyrhynchus]|uniref:Uncharacterized protein n=1 Tax=Rangifer tarandus platyrhynchus TaxID=3082113 RepID=A0AC59ZBE6_RANTA
MVGNGCPRTTVHCFVEKANVQRRGRWGGRRAQLLLPFFPKVQLWELPHPPHRISGGQERQEEGMKRTVSAAAQLKFTAPGEGPPPPPLPPAGPGPPRPGPRAAAPAPPGRPLSCSRKGRGRRFLSRQPAPFRPAVDLLQRLHLLLLSESRNQTAQQPPAERSQHNQRPSRLGLPWPASLHRRRSPRPRSLGHPPSRSPGPPPRALLSSVRTGGRDPAEGDTAPGADAAWNPEQNLAAGRPLAHWRDTHNTLAGIHAPCLSHYSGQEISPTEAVASCLETGG